MKKIMFYINSIHHGGAERVMVQLAEELTDAGFDTVLVTSFLDREWEYPLDPKVRRFILEDDDFHGGRIRKNIKRLTKLRRICRAEKPDYLISFMPQPIMRSLIATIGLPIVNIISIRNDPNKYWQTKSEKILSKIFLRRAKYLVLQTEAAKNYYKGTKFYDRATVIFNPVDNAFFDVKYHSQNKTVVTCGRLDTQKNHKLLIEAFSAFSKQNQEWSLKIYGAGPMKEELLRYIDDSEAKEKISLMGPSEDIPFVLSQTGIFVLSSDYEGLPNALMEALAAGIPSISTDCPCGGPAALIQNNVNGLLVPVNDADSLATALVMLAEDEDKRVCFSQNAKEMANAFRKNTIVQKWVELLKEIG